MRSGWQKLIEFVCQMEGREHCSGLPGLHSDTCVDVKDEADSFWLGFLTAREMGQWKCSNGWHS